ncbi:MAG TPA: CIA30 family protein [Gemmatimonadaceae bacterium]|nr:CIA30 family protein [Gemmatimonadaceae bacterium]
MSRQPNNTYKTLLTLIAGVALLCPQAPAAAQPGATPTLFHHVSVFDGMKSIGVRDVLVAEGKIAAIAPTIAAPRGALIVEGAGSTLLPGLIDAHTHVFGDALEQALVFGVTTELDMFTDWRFAANLRSEQKGGNVASRADLYSAGTLATSPGGHGTEYGLKIPTIDSPDSAQSWVDARVREGSDYIKIVYDDGSTYGMHIPTISRETLTALIRAAHRRGKLAVVHIGSLADAHTAIDAGADGLAHLFVDRDPDAGFGASVAAHHVFVVPTLTVLRSVTGVSGAGDLAADPRFALYLSASGRGTIGGAFPKGRATMTYAAAEDAVRQLKASGVPILAGTDSPNPGTAHGIALHRELELLVQAGLTPIEALAAATSTPARVFSLADRGRIAVGKRADLLLVLGDPTADITATRAIKGVWKGGVAFNRVPVPAPISPIGGVLPGMISNFDDGTTKSSSGTGWVVSTDQLAGGTSTATMKVVDGGAANTAKALESSGDVAPGLPFAWAGVMYMPGAQPMQAANLSAAKALHFWTKGDGETYHVMFFAESHGRMPLTVDFVAGPEWKEYVFPFAAFGGIDGHDVMGIAFTAGPSPRAFRFRIDEVRIQ